MTSPEFEQLILPNHRVLELFASQWTLTPQDCVQEAFLKLFASAPTIQQPRPWLFRVVRNLAIDAGRSEKSRKQREATYDTIRPHFESKSELPISTTELQAALAELPDEQREVIIARIWGELNLNEIATAFGIAISTAHRRYQLGIQKLQTHFELPCPTKKIN
jgi:RNA polymerase sigma-70 factor (ECF subfamily)